MRDHLYIGSAPAGEDCAQLGRDDFGPLNRLECRAYVDALRVKYGPEPEGCDYRLKRENHDFGTYYEVAIYYDDSDPVACDYAFEVENGLETWAEVGMTAPRLEVAA